MKSLLLAGVLALASAPAFAGQVIPLGAFNGVSASDGATVVVRHGATQQVTLVKGSLQYSTVDVRDGVLTAITCHTWHCPHNYEFEVDVVTPNIASVHASDGADIRADGNFPSQNDLAVHADDGGNVDTRAIDASFVKAHAEDGGNIRLRAQHKLDARAVDGGNIEYWGKPSVNMSAEDGGNVSQGD